MQIVYGESKMDGNTYHGSIISQDNARTLAHELGHKAGQYQKVKFRTQVRIKIIYLTPEKIQMKLFRIIMEQNLKKYSLRI